MNDRHIMSRLTKAELQQFIEVALTECSEQTLEEVALLLYSKRIVEKSNER